MLRDAGRRRGRSQTRRTATSPFPLPDSLTWAQWPLPVHTTLGTGRKPWSTAVCIVDRLERLAPEQQVQLACALEPGAAGEHVCAGDADERCADGQATAVGGIDRGNGRARSAKVVGVEAQYTEPLRGYLAGWRRLIFIITWSTVVDYAHACYDIERSYYTLVAMLYILC